MQFNPGTSDAQVAVSIVDEIDFLCDTDSTSYPTPDKTRRVNEAYEELIGKIVQADGTWQWHDTNHTDQPRGTGDLLEGQEQYKFASVYLQITGMEVLNTDGVTYSKIRPLDPSELSNNLTVDELFPTTGFPEFYDIVGDSFYLYPAPTSSAVTLTKGVRVYFKRTADLFVPTDTIQEPGIASPYHILLALKPALSYNMVYHPDRVSSLERRIVRMEEDMVNFYARREKDNRPVIRTRRLSYR